VDVDDVVIETHLALAFQKDINLFELRVAVPVACLFAGFVGGGGESDYFGV
jgi:hypothetical protein